MWTPILVGVFGLLGVIVGGFVNGVVSAGLERVRAAQLAMVTARLVQADLLYIEAVVATEMNEANWNRLAKDAPPVSFDSWDDGREALASGLDYKDWAVVEIAARQALRVVVVAPRNFKPPGTPMSAAEKASLGTLLPEMQKAVHTLKPLAHGVHVPSLWQAIRSRRTGSQPAQ